MASDKDLKVQNLNDQIEYIRDLITDLLRDQEIDHEEIKYLSAFISYKKLEDDLLTEANQLGIGPLGFHGRTTALKVQVEYAPTHIAGLPVAVNMCCHVCRHARMVI